MKAKLWSETDGNNGRELLVPGNADLQSFMHTAGAASFAGLQVGAFMEMIVRQAPLAMVVCDGKRKITLANVAAKRMAQTNPEGRPLEDAPSIWGEMFDLKRHRIPAKEWPCMRALQGEVTIDREYHMVRSDRTAYDAVFTAVPITVAGKRIVGAVTTLLDISGRKLTELMLRHEAVSRERNRMAADIHDTLCQALSAIVFQLQAADGELLDDVREARQHLRRAHGIARESLAEIRRCIWTLSDDPMEGADLPTALSCLAQRLFATTPVKLEVSVLGESCALLPEMRKELLRIGREALTNVIKHAQATKVYIKLAYTHRDVQLSVNDDGHGFARFRFPTSHSSFGLIGMQKRAERLGGKVMIDSRPGQGTRVFALLPLR